MINGHSKIPILLVTRYTEKRFIRLKSKEFFSAISVGKKKKRDGELVQYLYFPFRIELTYTTPCGLPAHRSPYFVLSHQCHTFPAPKFHSTHFHIPKYIGVCLNSYKEYIRRVSTNFMQRRTEETSRNEVWAMMGNLYR